MFLEVILRIKLLSNMSAENDDDKLLMDVVFDLGVRLLAEVAKDYSKLATSFLATHSNIYVVLHVQIPSFFANLLVIIETINCVLEYLLKRRNF